MSYNEEVLPVPADFVWRMLCDPRPYAQYVVGAKRIRCFDPGWPDLGTTIHHTVGCGPFALRDRSTVVDVEDGRRLELRAGLRPMGVTTIVFTVEPVDARSSRLGIEEYPVEGPLTLVWNQLLDRAMWLRNKELLRRFRRIAIQRAAVVRAP